MREQIERKYVEEIERKKRNVWLKQEVVVTIHRLIFRGEKREGVMMDMPLCDIKETKIGKDPQNRAKEVPVIGIVNVDQNKPEIVLKFNMTNPQSLTKVHLLDKFIAKVKNPLEFGDEAKLKGRLLAKNKVLWRVYKNLVQDKKYLTDEEFWHRHNFLELSEYQLMERTENIKHLHEVKHDLYREFNQPPKVYYDKDDPEYLKREISNLSIASSKAEEVNNATHEAIYQ